MPTSQLLFSFGGRINRKPFWLVTLLLVAIMIVVLIAVFAIWGGAVVSGNLSGLGVLAVLLLVVYIPMLWISLALGAKRLHDRNKSAWWLVVFWLVPGVLQGIGEQIGTAGIALTVAAIAISIWGLVELGFLRGTVGSNQYGPDPLEGKA